MLNDLLAPPALDDAPRVEPADDISVIHQPRRWAVVLIGALVMVLAGGGLWWHHAVTADPGLEFDGGPNVFRAEQFHGYFGLYNHGSRDVTIEAVPPTGFPFGGFDGLAVSENWHTALTGRDYAPFGPFTLRAGETRFVRLEFHMATCDPAGLRNGDSRIDSLPVRYRVLGVTRTVRVPFDQVSIAVQTAGTCDHPVAGP